MKLSALSSSALMAFCLLLAPASQAQTSHDAEKARHTLTVSLAGSGAVSSTPAGIDCGDTCRASFDKGTQVALTATPAEGWYFKRWGGGCSGTEPVCNIRISANRTAKAEFELVEVKSISAGLRHACALMRDGSAKCWGNNAYGQLGTGNWLNSYVPVVASAVGSDMVAISAGAAHTCALTTGGGVKCWGGNRYGQLGDGSGRDSLVPVAVSGLSRNVIAISAGHFHTCALIRGGAVKCWGFNGRGGLGDGSSTNRHVPVDVWGLDRGVKAISAGDDFSCAVTAQGGVQCWGYNGHGQLGDNSYIDRLIPQDVSGLNSGISAISAGDNRTCALTRRGGVLCWGSGYLGTGHTAGSRIPVNVSGLERGVVAIEASPNISPPQTKTA